MKKIREMMKSRKGFTLVEIIVVLVILAILAAFTIPAMLGYVNSAKEKAHLAEARTCLIAAQACIDEYGTKEGQTVDNVVADLNAHNDTKKTGAYAAYQNYLTGDIDTDILVATGIVAPSGKINKMVLTGTGYMMTFNGTDWSYTNVPGK